LHAFHLIHPKVTLNQPHQFQQHQGRELDPLELLKGAKWKNLKRIATLRDGSPEPGADRDVS